jgi:hypothetical protein
LTDAGRILYDKIKSNLCLGRLCAKGDCRRYDRKPWYTQSAVAQTFLSFCCEHPLAKDWESD